MTTYELLLTDQLGAPLKALTQWQSLSWARRVNEVGAFVVTLPRESFDRKLFGVDRRLQIWRLPEEGTKQLVMSGFLRYLRQVSDEQGRQAIEMGGPDAVDLLARRIIDGDSESAAADKSGYADDVMKEYVDENLGSGAPAARDISAYGFSVQSNLSNGPSIEKAASRRNLLTILQEIAATAANQGIRTYFDVVHPTPTTYEFRTYTGQRGVDRSYPDGLSPVILSEYMGTLVQPDLIQDWREEITYVYAAGQGEGDARLVVGIEDEIRRAASVFNRREELYDGRNAKDVDKLISAGQAFLKEGEPRRTFDGEIADVPNNRFGKDWNFGDKATAAYEDEQYTVLIEAVSAEVSAEGQEELRGRLTYVG